MSGRVQGKVAIITGSSAGIGRASAEMMALEGAKVVISASGRRPELCQEVVNGIKARGGEASFFKCDVRNTEEIQPLIKFAVEKYGRLDILVNNAVAGGNNNIIEQKEDEWDELFTSSVKACYISCKHAIPEMIKVGGGSIINLASVHGMFGGRNVAAYSSAKAAIINLSRQAAVDFGPQNIRVNAVCPGRIVTEGKVTFLEKNPLEYRRQKCVYPLGRPGTMLECAYPILFLASDESSFITGQTIVVDGGLTAQLQDGVSLRIEQGISEELAQRGIQWP